MQNKFQLDPSFSTTRQITNRNDQSFNVTHNTSKEEMFESDINGGLRKHGYFKSSISDLPLITVVTVVYNGEDFLEETILSVINQSYDNVEYIVIDGGSSDSTVDVIKKYNSVIDYWVSESDEGIYDAMNKGISSASGDWVNFMNAGDKFCSDDTLAKLPLLDNVKSPLLYGNKVQSEVTVFPMPEKKLRNGEIMACHQSMFFNLSLEYKDTVLYDISYKIYGDYELVNRLYLKFGNFFYTNQNIAIFQGGGISSLVSAQKRKDKYRALLKSYGIFGVIRGLWFRLLK